MAADDLNAPLGQTTKRSFKLPVSLPQAIAGALGLFVALFVLWALFADNPFGGEPMVVVSAQLPARDSAKTAQAKAADKAGPSKATAPAKTDAPPEPQGPAIIAGPKRYDGPGGTGAKTARPDAPAIPPGAKTVNIIDGTSGERREVVIPGTPDSKGAGPDKKLAETTRHGLIPKVAADGTRVADAFAQPVQPAKAKPDTPRIAIVLGGLGMSASQTAAAIAELPGPVTFAVTPYGQDLETLAARMREGGHEVLLQVPMEPFDYPDNDPGPKTLLTTLNTEQNTDRLHWLMSRFQGYVGIVNFMGERFTATEKSFAPVLRETATRGLIYLDDGSSPRSVAGQLAGASNLPFARANVVIDATPTPVEIDRALGRLENLARQQGVAVGTAHALPVTIDRLAKWTKAAAERGVLLVPISAVAAKAKSS